MNKFSTAIKYLRLREGLTQKELADKLSVAKSTISMYENDARVPELERLEEIADFFNVDMNFLLGKSNMPPEDVGEQKLRLMELFDKVPEDNRELVVRMVEAALKSQGLL